MKYRVFPAYVCAAVLCTGCAGMIDTTVTERPYYETLVPEEGPLPGIPAEVNYADYWIRAVPYPDEPIMTAEDIEAFNRDNPFSGSGIIDITALADKCEGANIRRYIADNARYLLERRYLVTGAIPLEQTERLRIVALMDTAGVPDTITLRFGVVLDRTLGRVWPTAVPLYEDIGDNEFDQGVTAELDMGETVALLHTSKDGLWSFVQTSMFLCWVPSGTVAFGDRATVAGFVNCSPPLVATAHRVSVYGSPEEKVAVGSIQMGSTLPIRTAGTDFCEVLVPGRDVNGRLAVHVGYVRRSSDISIGYLPYTLRNLYRQCFVLFGRRYGWGGMYGERDCSRYIMDVFGCFNIRLPRNSAGQSKVSRAVVELDGLDRDAKLDILRTLPRGISLLYMPGHIMILLGTMDGTPYAIHDFWAWRTPTDSGPDIVHRVARVAVTDLMLGTDSEKGAFIDRLSRVAILGNYRVK